ncbi:MAG: hypothetical protein JW891_16145 [Candidatus Lokiarchaeota archaeon]|nr:hypothetical protein [Candidatus Lokiarchaeota archaeon]
MINGKLRKPEEIIQRYKKHPNFRDIYCEGPTDKNFYNLVLKELNINVKIYPISTLNIQESIAENLGLKLKLEEGAKKNVIILSRFLESKLEKKYLTNYRCIIDKDFDFYFGLDYSSLTLYTTDYNCVEMYVFNELAVNKFITPFSNVPFDSKKIIKELKNVLEKMFLIRLVDKSMNLCSEWKNFINNCKIKKCKIYFNCNSFLEKYFNQNKITGERRKRFLEEFKTYRHHITKDCRNQIHKLDLRMLFIKYIRSCCKTSDYNKNSEFFPLFQSVEINDIKKENLFIKLNTWYFNSNH